MILDTREYYQVTESMGWELRKELRNWSTQTNSFLRRTRRELQNNLETHSRSDVIECTLAWVWLHRLSNFSSIPARVGVPIDQFDRHSFPPFVYFPSDSHHPEFLIKNVLFVNLRDWWIEIILIREQMWVL